MTSSATPVPSRNALRALRNLAFSHPAIFAGAVGSACCTAAVSCEIQRRVRLAEKLVATKRTLRSISDGKGNARVAQMCEAAERGENFLLDQRSAQRRRRRRVRHQSTAAAWQEDDEQDHVVVQTQWKEPDAGPSRRVIDGPNEVNKNGATGLAFRSAKGTKIPAWATGAPQTYPSKLHARPHIPHRGAIPDPPSTRVSESHLKGAATHAWIMDSQRQHNSVSAEKVRAASMKALKPHDYHIYGRKSHLTEPEAVRTGDYTALGEHTVKATVTEAKPHQPVDEEDATVFETSGPVLPESLSATDPESVNGVRADTMPVRDAPGEINGYASSGPILSPRLSTDLAAVEPAMPDTGVDRSHLPDTMTAAPFQWQSPLSDFLDFARRAKLQPVDDADRSYSALGDELNAGSSVDFDYEKSKYFRRVHSEAAESHIDLQKLYAKPSDKLTPFRRLDGVSRRHFLHNIAILFEGGQFEQAERRYHSEYDPQRHGLFPPVARILVQHLLSDSSTHHRAIRILFPECRQATRGKSIMGQRPWFRAHFFMQEICALSSDSTVWEAQATAILDAARAAGIQGHAKVLESITRALCAQGHARRAEDLINSVTKEHKLQKFIPLDRLLVLSYARNHDWTAVNRIMQSLQEDGVPRERPNWYSALFKEVFTLHLQDHSLELAYDYLVNAMGYWKLAPTRTISCTLIAACIRSGDYVHLQQWIEAIRSMWPRVDIGTGSRRLAIEIAMVWTENQATCEQMERACSAMAFGSIDDPFSSYFRSITQELAAADLRRQIEDCAPHAGSSLLPDESQAKTLPELVAFAEEYLIHDTADQDSEPCRKHALESLSRQIRAIERLNQVMAGRLPEHMGILEDLARELPTASIFPTESDEGLKATPQHVPAALRSCVLPHMQTLWPIMGKEYARQYRQGRSSSHDLLEYVVAELQSQGRDVDAAQLLESVAASPFVTGENGKHFSAQLYGEWLSIASRLDSVKQSHKAMWAILDASRYLKVTSLLVLRAAHCANFTHVGRWGDDPDPKSPDAELVYLYRRIRKLRWVQLGMNEAPKLAEWTPWGKQEHVVPLVSSFGPHGHTAFD